jgi:hypothetical protein
LGPNEAPFYLPKKQVSLARRRQCCVPSELPDTTPALRLTKVIRHLLWRTLPQPLRRVHVQVVTKICRRDEDVAYTCAYTDYVEGRFACITALRRTRRWGRNRDSAGVLQVSSGVRGGGVCSFEIADVICHLNWVDDWLDGERSEMASFSGP